MTEQEAKEKWCPWRNLEYVKEGRGIANNRIDETFRLGSASRCVTKDCMAWRDGECIRLCLTYKLRGLLLEPALNGGLGMAER